MAHHIIDECGIDIVHGHSSHYVQGVEKYKEKLTIYGCGDFVDGYALMPGYQNDLSGVWRVTVEETADTAGLKLKKLEDFAAKIDKFVARTLSANEEESKWARDKITELRAQLGTSGTETQDVDGQLVIDIPP